ncbi:hypothetical protein GWI33_000155 [Rhynchophorus ferrugineus]|uniref:Myeloid differentiation primary response protein MyD88 n=1 Tax=Rhynchophorus ferrugineus TaxID=354439 RepID=A0A834MLE5_RHYFE|nr:hypothetical protein GWI33_000155 [Rhynchophorus ferrugineus]
MDASGNDNNNANNSILVLKANTRNMISNLLNPHKFLKNDKGIPRDWQGLAELCGISGVLIPSISSDHDPTAKVLQIWAEKCKSEATVDKLLTYLEQLDREDIVDDVLPLIVEDLKSFKDHPENAIGVEPFNFEYDKLIVTIDDLKRVSKGLGPQMYDAFVLFEDDDIAFATELIEIMEKKYNLKFCVKERDLIAGKSEHEAIIKLITERCGRVIVILSPEFLQSNVNKFFYSLTQSIAIEQRQRKIIPYFRRAGPFWNFWDKLSDSIKIPEYKPKMKLSLPDNSLFSNNENVTQNVVSRSLSNAEKLTLPSNMKSAMHSVKFNSMTNLPVTDVPRENIVPSTSANCLEKYEDKNVRKPSFYQKIKKLKTIFPKSKIKSENPITSDQSAPEINNQEEIAISVTNKNEKKNSKSEQTALNSNSTDIKNQKKGKKSKFTLKRNKKKVALLADT